MLYMVINTHSPESCAFRGEDEASHLEPAFEKFESLTAERGVDVQGQWINRPGHEAFVLVDAADPHVIDDIVVASGLVGRTRTRVVSVIALEDAVTPYTEQVVAAAASK